MIFLPVDLFSPFIKGREYAIDRNWNDRNQFNKVVNDQLSNDRSALRNLFSETTFGDQVARSNAASRTAQNQAALSDMDLGLSQAGYGGRLGLTQAQSATQEAQAAAILGNLPQYANTINRQTQSDLDMWNNRINAANTYNPAFISNTAQNNVNNSQLTGELIQTQRELNRQRTAPVPQQQSLFSTLGSFGGQQTPQPQPQPVPTQQGWTPDDVTVSNGPMQAEWNQVFQLQPGQAMVNPVGGGYQYMAKDANGFIYAYNIDGNGAVTDMRWVSGPQASGG